MDSSFQDTIERGVAREQERLAGSTFIVLRYNRDLDYDGFSESLELLDGFTDMASAIDAVDQLAKKTSKESLGILQQKNPQWRHNETRTDAGILTNHGGALVRRIHLRSFELTDDSMYNKQEVLFEVLCVTLPDAIGPELFAYYDAPVEWKQYFHLKGK
jgi:hypothetical protein